MVPIGASVPSVIKVTRVIDERHDFSEIISIWRNRIRCFDIGELRWPMFG
jgi:hypothetical protein